MEGTGVERLTRKDIALLIGFCVVSFGLFLLDGKTRNVHETVHCQNAREMMADGDWLVPHYAGRPWLERPPLPFWITMPFLAAFGDADWVFLAPPLLLATASVVMLSWMTSLWFGRVMGLISGLILASMQEFVRYATIAECDMFLCFLVTSALALFVKSEFAAPTIDLDRRFFGRRPLSVLGFFVVLGLTNLTKGLLFGTLVTGAPVVGYLLFGRRASLPRYLWGWGWLSALATAAFWPICILLRYHDAPDFWFDDYINRAFVETPRENAYYLVQLTMMLAPWTICGITGLWLLRAGDDPRAKLGRAFVLAWVFVPLVGLSLARHKHHHYLLHAVAPWSVFAAAGAIRAWQWLRSAPNWLRHPLTGLFLLGLPYAIAIYLFRAKFPSPVEWAPYFAAGWIVVAVVGWFGAFHRRGAVAFGTMVCLVAFCRLVADFYEVRFLDKYKNDLAFLHHVTEIVPQDRDLLIYGDDGALVASWWMYQSRGRTKYLHNLTFLRDEKLDAREVFVIGRRKIETGMNKYGVPEVVAESERSRGETRPEERYTLFRLRYHDNLVRRPNQVRYSPLQATLRAPGPYLE